MSYLLKKYDTNLLEFEFIHTMDSSSVNILKVYENDKKLLPLDCEIDNTSLFKWLKNRTIPANRAYVQNFLARNGLNEKDTEGIIRISKGLSLNDIYWVVDSEFDGKFDDYNLYDNRFSRVLSLIAFTGYGSYVGTTFRSSPEFTTGGMLAKCGEGRMVRSFSIRQEQKDLRIPDWSRIQSSMHIRLLKKWGYVQ